MGLCASIDDVSISMFVGCAVSHTNFDGRFSIPVVLLLKSIVTRNSRNAGSPRINGNFGRFAKMYITVGMAFKLLLVVILTGSAATAINSPPIPLRLSVDAVGFRRRRLAVLLPHREQNAPVSRSALVGCWSTFTSNQRAPGNLQLDESDDFSSSEEVEEAELEDVTS